MYKHNKCNSVLADECLRFIELYRGMKSNDISDVFYHSHLDFFENLIQGWKDTTEGCFAVIMCKSIQESNKGYSPIYATICVKPHWNEEGVLLQSGLYDATKFTLDDEDLYILFDYVKHKFPDREFKIVFIDKDIFGDSPREVWSNEEVKGDFANTGKIAGQIVKDIDDDDIF